MIGASVIGLALSAALALHAAAQMVMERRSRAILVERAGARNESRPKRVRRRPAPGGLRLFPDFLELVALGLSAGLVLESAWARALEALPASVVRTELAHALELVRLGRSRASALRDAGERLGDPRLAMVIALLSQSLERGNDVRPVLLDQAASLRAAHLIALERRAQTAPLRLLIPILLLLLPAVFLVLLAPLVIRASVGASPF